MYKKIIRSLIPIFLITVNILNAQSVRKYTTNNNGWYTYTGNHKIADKW